MRTQAWVRRSLSDLWNHIPVWNVTFVVVIKFEVSIGDQFLSVEFWHVSYSGLRQSPCEFVVTVVTEACFTDCVFEISHANIIPNHYWYVVLLIKTVINFQYDDRIVKTFLENNPTI